MLLRTAVELRAAHIAPRKILAALRKLNATLPAELPLTGLRITAVGNDVTVRDGRSQWQAESGQLVMDFEVARRPRAASASCSAAHRRRRRRTPAGGGRCRELVRAAARRSRRATGAAAEAAYRTALALDPEHADASLNLGALALRSAAAATRPSRSTTRPCGAIPDEALLHFNRAIALEDQGRLAEALASYNTSLRLAPDLADAHFNAARLHEQLGDAKKAVRHLSAYRRLQRR